MRKTGDPIRPTGGRRRANRFFGVLTRFGRVGIIANVLGAAAGGHTEEMQRMLGLTLAATTALSVAALAAPEHDRVRGTVTSTGGGTLIVRAAGGDVTIVLNDITKFADAEKSNCEKIRTLSSIGPATKAKGPRA